MRALLSESLIRNSWFLVANLGISAACGYGALGLLTRFYSVRAVGLAAAAISAGGVIAFVTQFGANYSLPRFLPTSPYRTALINTVLTVTIAATLVGGGAFLSLPLANRLYALGGGAFVVTFLVSVSLDAGESQLENIFVADRCAAKITSANVITNLIKVAAPVSFVFLGIFGAYLARVVGYVVGFIVLAAMLGKRGHRYRPTLSTSATRDLRRFSMGAYFGGLIGGLPLMVMPIIILDRFGPEQNAYWYTALAVASLLYQLPGSVSQALLAEAAHRPNDRRYLLKRASGLIGVVMAPVLTVSYFAAPLGLAFLGHSYEASGVVVLHWLVLAGFASSLNYITGTILYLAKRTLWVVLINLLNAAVVIGLSTTWARNISDIGGAWLAGELVNAVLFGIAAGYAVIRVRGRWQDLGSHRSSPDVQNKYEPRHGGPSQWR